MSKKTLETIVESENEYIVKVKRNQKKLYETIEKYTKEEEPLKTDRNREKTRNRQSERKVEIFSVPPNLDSKWNSVSCVMKVERQGTRGSQPYHRIGYYMSSLSPNHPKLANLIREHWQIENRLHLVKDVIQLEDKSSQKAGSALINLSLFTANFVQTRYKYGKMKKSKRLIKHGSIFARFTPKNTNGMAKPRKYSKRFSKTI